jgi:hypothetical protein
LAGSRAVALDSRSGISADSTSCIPSGPRSACASILYVFLRHC